MKIIRTITSLSELWQNRKTQTTDLFKIVVDIKRNIVAVDAEMHSDLEDILLEDGSKQEDLWGANLFPERDGNQFIEYTSFINIRPAQNNRSMEVKDDKIKKEILKIVNQLIEK